jgi:hypothetical protein
MSERFLLPLPSHTATYAASSSRPSDFQLPPLDGSLLIPEIYDWHLVHNPNHTCFIYEDGTRGSKNLTYRDVVPAAHRAAHYVARAMNIDANDRAARPAIAVVATSGISGHNKP